MVASKAWVLDFLIGLECQENVIGPFPGSSIRPNLVSIRPGLSLINQGISQKSATVAWCRISSWICVKRFLTIGREKTGENENLITTRTPTGTTTGTKFVAIYGNPIPGPKIMHLSCTKTRLEHWNDFANENQMWTRTAWVWVNGGGFYRSCKTPKYIQISSQNKNSNVGSRCEPGNAYFISRYLSIFGILLLTYKLIMTLLNKKVVLSQRRPRNVPYTWVPWKFLGLPDYAHGYYSQHFSWAFVPIDPMNNPTKFEVRSSTRSWDYRGYPKNWVVPGYIHAPPSPNF